MTYGYRYGEVPTPKIEAIKPIRIVERTEDVTVRRPVAISLGPHAEGVALPHCDPDSRDTIIAGALKRFASLPPDADMDLLEEYGDFVWDFCEKNFVPIAPDADASVESWLIAAPYSEARKAELRRKWDAVSEFWGDERYKKVKSFMKDEGYAATVFKHARGINSRTDEAKCKIAPVFKLIEKVVFEHAAFIKKIPVDRRARYIMDRVYREGGSYIATDYETFEALFVKVLMIYGEFQLYRYMTQYMPEATDVEKFMLEVLAGTNHCVYKLFEIWIEATRMSGEMCTSLGNGFTNLMMLKFACHKVGAESYECVEGDDGIARCEGGTPTKELFARLGMKIKLEKFDDLSEASFCGIVFDTVELRNVTDPKKVLASFGWTENRYARAKTSKLRQLLRCKALSLAHQYPGCPIISALARYGLRVTEGVTVGRRVIDSMNNYQREFFGFMLDADLSRYKLTARKRIPDIPVGPRTRDLVAKLYGISIAQQLALEELLDGKHDMSPIDVSVIEFPGVWYEYYSSYSLPVNMNSIINQPGYLWEVRAGHRKEWEIVNPT